MIVSINSGSSGNNPALTNLGVNFRNRGSRLKTSLNIGNAFSNCPLPANVIADQYGNSGFSG